MGPVAFYSKGLNTAQRKYSTYDRELLGAVLAIKKFKPFLEGREFVLRTDHKSLVPSLLLAGMCVFMQGLDGCLSVCWREKEDGSCCYVWGARQPQQLLYSSPLRGIRKLSSVH